MVACVVVSIALIGVYGIFREAMSMEKNASRLWDDRAAAAAVVAHLAETLEHAVNLPGVPAIVGKPGEEENEYVLTCTAVSAGHVAGARGLTKRRRYRWTCDPEDAGAGCLKLQTLTYAGTKNVTAIDGLAGLDEKQTWERAEVKVIAGRLKRMSVSYKPVNTPDAEWTDRWHGRAGRVMVRISVTVGNRKCERLVTPRADASRIDGQGESP